MFIIFLDTYEGLPFPADVLILQLFPIPRTFETWGYIS